MKKSLIILLILMYILPAIGINISVHYCENQIASISLMYSNKTLCSCNPSQEDEQNQDDCCKNKSVNIKFLDQFKIVDFKSNLVCKNVIDVSDYFLSFLNIHNFDIKSNFENSLTYNSRHPPDRTSTSLLILNQVFRI